MRSCPNWRTARGRLREVLDELERGDVEIREECVQTPEDAARLGFSGSPTILLDDHDPFPATWRGGLAGRLSVTEEGIAGSPSPGRVAGAGDASDLLPHAGQAAAFAAGSSSVGAA